ncbi:MAG: hypothetical protein WA364_24220, partial [Candidatus Nitrosopolaris sp.]
LEAGVALHIFLAEGIRDFYRAVSSHLTKRIGAWYIQNKGTILTGPCSVGFQLFMIGAFCDSRGIGGGG